MPLIDTVTLTDGEATPIAHVFSVANKVLSKDGYTVVFMTAPDASGEAHLASTLEFRTKLLKDGSRRTKTYFVQRFTHDGIGEYSDVNNGTYTNTMATDTKLSMYSQTQDRANLLAMWSSYYPSAVAQALIVAQEGLA